MVIRKKIKGFKLVSFVPVFQQVIVWSIFSAGYFSDNLQYLEIGDKFIFACFAFGYDAVFKKDSACHGVLCHVRRHGLSPHRPRFGPTP